MSSSFIVPVSTKIRLCQPQHKTLEFAERLEASGSSWITLHARTVSARRRRQGAADLSEVKRLKDSDKLHVPIISNGNVRVFTDLTQNLEYTGADGLMVGETLLGNPWSVFALNCFESFLRLYVIHASIFSNTVPDPVTISLEYLDLCRTYADTASIPSVKAHARHIVDFQCSRRPWFTKFRTALGDCTNLDEIEYLLSRKVERWRGRPPRKSTFKDVEDDDRDGRIEGPSGGGSDLDVDIDSSRLASADGLTNILDVDDLNLDLDLP